MSQTLSKLLSPNAKLLVLTSTSVPFEVLSRVYTLPQLGPLKRCEFAKVEHEGGRIQVSRSFRLPSDLHLRTHAAGDADLELSAPCFLIRTSLACGVRGMEQKTL